MYIAILSELLFLQHVEITSITTHPKYDAKNYHNDFALLKLAKQAKIRETAEKYLCLPKNPTGLLNYEQLVWIVCIMSCHRSKILDSSSLEKI